MLKRNITYVLSLFLTIATFSSCNQPDNTGDIIDDGVGGLEFCTSYYVIGENGAHYLELGYPINECAINDTVMLHCSVHLERWPYYDTNGVPQIIVKVTSSKTGDVKYITLVERENVVYHTGMPPPPTSFIGRLHFSYVNGEDGSLRVSPDGDILIAEIENNPEITTTLTIKGIENE